MRKPRRWMATLAAVALISTLVVPAEAVMIRYYQPLPGEEYVGDPDIPFGGRQLIASLMPIQLAMKVQLMVVNFVISAQCRTGIERPVSDALPSRVGCHD